MFQNDAIAPLVEWMNTSSTLATVLILTSAGVWLAELLCRRGSQPEPDTLRFYLRQKGGIKNINLCMLAIPQGDQRKIQTSLVETQPLIVQQRFRFIIIDTALLLFAYTTTFIMVAWFSAFVTGMTLVLLPGAFIALVFTLTLIVVFRLLKPSAASGWGLFHDEVTSDQQGRAQKVSRLTALRGS